MVQPDTIQRPSPSCCIHTSPSASGRRPSKRRSAFTNRNSMRRSSSVATSMKAVPATSGSDRPRIGSKRSSSRSNTVTCVASSACRGTAADRCIGEWVGSLPDLRLSGCQRLTYASSSERVFAASRKHRVKCAGDFLSCPLRRAGQRESFALTCVGLGAVICDRGTVMSSIRLTRDCIDIASDLLPVNPA